MPKRKNKQTHPEKEKLYEMLTRFEECVCDAITLNSALMILIDNEKFNDMNYELLLQISRRLNEAKGKIPQGYQVMKEMR